MTSTFQLKPGEFNIDFFNKLKTLFAGQSLEITIKNQDQDSEEYNDDFANELLSENAQLAAGLKNGTVRTYKNMTEYEAVNGL
ncbi:MAG: hypothetical protein SPJ89_03660 [Treponema sp.]|nr:hypothetical protein [Spirochaetia bacterium]MDD7460065.1 hypothetical protein [Spirochaetales bacterium]MDY5811053.1 hypothetical protein [Treponema sp.]